MPWKISGYDIKKKLFLLTFLYGWHYIVSMVHIVVNSRTNKRRIKSVKGFILRKGVVNDTFFR